MKSSISLLLIMILSIGLIYCAKDKIDYQVRLDKIKKLKQTDEQAYISHLSSLLKAIEKENPVYDEALNLLVNQLIENAREWEDMGRYSEAADIYLQAGRMNRDNQKLKELYSRAKAYEDLTLEDFNRILIGMTNIDLHKIAGNPYKIETMTDDKDNTIHEYHFLTKANQWDSVVITLDEDLKVIDKKYPEIQNAEEQKE